MKADKSTSKWYSPMELAKAWYPDGDTDTLERVRKHIFAKAIVGKNNFFEVPMANLKQRRTDMKSNYWFVQFPGEVYANDFCFKSPVSLDYVKQSAREFLGVTRLPRGTQFWRGTK